MTWQPGCELEALKYRARLLSAIRQFFFKKSVLEVDTPLLSHVSVTDLHLASVTAQLSLPGYSSAKTMYLQTSPEFSMKRLLASGSGSIYQIAKCFRDGERGRRHNPEFTMLEWYRLDFSLQDLMDEVAELLSLVANLPRPEKITYQQAFQRYLNIDPHRESDKALAKLAKEKTGVCGNDLSRDDCLDLLLTHCIEPELGCEKPVFMTEYPASQASLAKVKERDGILLAQRFELYVNGLELANGYDELVDANEQLQRFEADNEARKAHDLPEIPIDYNLVEALKSGLPECSGIALGLDRLQMVIQDAKCIDEVISFTVERA